MTFVKGQSGNPAGKKPGTIDVRKRMKKLLADPEMFEAIVSGQKRKPKWLSQLEKRGKGANTPADLMLMAMISRAASGDSKAFSAAMKYTIGDKVDLTSDEQPIPLLGLNHDVYKPQPKASAKKAVAKKPAAKKSAAKTKVNPLPPPNKPPKMG